MLRKSLAIVVVLAVAAWSADGKGQWKASGKKLRTLAGQRPAAEEAVAPRYPADGLGRNGCQPGSERLDLIQRF